MEFSADSIDACDSLKRHFHAATPPERLAFDNTSWWHILQRQGFTPDDLRLRDLLDSLEVGESIRRVSALAAAEEYRGCGYMHPLETSQQDSMFAEEIACWWVPWSKACQRAPCSPDGRLEVVSQSSEGVRVQAGEEVFLAGACVCAIPASVLNGIVFEPALPKAQAAAAEELQYPRIVKTRMLFSKRFWPAEDSSLLTDRTSQPILSYDLRSTRGAEDIVQLLHR